MAPSLDLCPTEVEENSDNIASESELVKRSKRHRNPTSPMVCCLMKVLIENNPLTYKKSVIDGEQLEPDPGLHRDSAKKAKKLKVWPRVKLSGEHNI